MLELGQAFIADFIRLHTLPPETRAKLEACLEEMAPSLDCGAAVKNSLERAFPADTGGGDLSKIILAMHYAFANSPKGLPEFAGEVATAARRQDPDSTADFSEESLAKTVAGILQIRPLALGYKAAALALETERGFLSSRIISDIRPVFGTDLKSPEISAAFVLHSLHIGFRTINDEDDFFVTLTTKDLQELQKTIDRALEKSEGLSHLIPKLSPILLEEK